MAPSDALRRWFGHDPARWEEFRRRYFAELDAHPEVWAPIAEALGRGPVTLLYAARDRERNNAVALRDYLLARLGELSPRTRAAGARATARRRTPSAARADRPARGPVRPAT